VLLPIAHALGLGALVTCVPIGKPAAVLSLGALLIASLGGKPRRLAWPVLAPLGLTYLAILTRLTFVWVGVDLDPYTGASFPNPLSAWLHLMTPALAALAWCWLRSVQHSQGRSRLLLLILLPVGLSGWYLVTVVRHLSEGVTGSDPYGYVQMALDLVRYGTALHRYPLASLAERLGIATWPTVPVGYATPLAGQAATVWPPAWSVALALAFVVAGERAMFWLAPLCHVGAAVLSGLVAVELVKPSDHMWRAVLAGLAATVTLTSYEGVLRTLVPMADAVASLAGAAMALFLLRAMHRDRLGLSLAAGCLWGAAYAVRHPQLLLGLAALGLLLVDERPWPRRLAHVGLFLLGGVVLALPDLVYHVQALGSPWRAESAEWFLLSPGNIVGNWRALWRDGWWRANEWGYVWPAIAVGAAATLRRETRRATIALFAGYGGCLLFHLCYGALRLRDLVPLFPWLAALVAVGAVTLRRFLSRWPRDVSVLCGAILALGLAARTADTLALPAQASVWTFGYVTQAERRGLETLADLTPDDAVIATGLNAGAVQLYADRETVRPAAWSAEELARFAGGLAQQGRPLYVLDDGEEMAAWIAAQPAPFEPVATLALPRQGRGGQPQGSLGTLYSATR